MTGVAQGHQAISSCRVLALLLASAAMLSNTPPAAAQSGSCTRPSASITLSDIAVDSLAGTYRIEMIADVPRRARVEGTLTLWKNYEEHIPLLGRAHIALDSVGATYMIPMGSFDRERHDVFALNFSDGLQLIVGRPVVRGGKMNDGAGTELLIRGTTATGFVGTWSASSGPTTYRAAGYFCAVRSKERL
jgi:hypothetical protein